MCLARARHTLQDELFFQSEQGAGTVQPVTIEEGIAQKVVLPVPRPCDGLDRRRGGRDGSDEKRQQPVEGENYFAGQFINRKQRRGWGQCASESWVLALQPGPE